ncbi:MAG TPA: outer membrane lipoprotein-sorting protein [Candidatus Wallbacteria bacterium]|nr:outer membrane lipoprotein-sorting protein [Candidatus Wallbacteria bacterium]
MKNYKTAFLLAAVFLCSAFTGLQTAAAETSETVVTAGPAAAQAALTSEQVLQKVEDRYVGKTSKAEMKMILADSSNEQKERTLTIYRRKIDNANLGNFQHFHSPADMMNTTFLVNEKDGSQEKFIYLPSFKKIRKIVSKDNNVRYVSSDFSYEDLDNFHAADYICEKLKEEKYENEDVYVVECRKTSPDSQYSKFIFKISKEKELPLVALLYDKKSGDLLKQIENRKLKKVKNIWTPFEVEIKDLKNSSSTKLTLDKIEYDINLSEDTFTQRNMEK